MLKMTEENEPVAYQNHHPHGRLPDRFKRKITQANYRARDEAMDRLKRAGFLKSDDDDDQNLGVQHV